VISAKSSSTRGRYRTRRRINRNDGGSVGSATGFKTPDAPAVKRHKTYAGARVQEFARPILQAFLTLTDLHAHALTFYQPAEPAAHASSHGRSNEAKRPCLRNRYT
jgi:hypothetical protein